MTLTGYDVTADFTSTSYTDLNKLCIVYGEDLTGLAKCGDTALVESSYYYSGTFLVVLFDNATNYILVSHFID